MQLSLPVSLGEAIDKLTILNIKFDKIKDNRKLDVQKEYDILYEKLKGFIETYNELYISMKKVNLLIWDQMDILRDGSISDEDYTKLCRECVDSNDVRFRIKNKINLISNSEIKEQKSYKINRIFIKLNCNDDCISLFIKPIKYFSFIYDEIIIESSNNIEEIKKTFYYDNTIKYNIELKDDNFKQEYIFEKNNYLLNEIYEIISINEKDLELI
jgi:hypothetical protein